MTTAKDTQRALNRLVRHRQYRELRTVIRPPVLGATGTGLAGEAETVPEAAAALVYIPLADEAVHGWGSPFGPNPPMGTVQPAWDPAQLIYRIVDEDQGAWTVEHQRPDLACGSRWWRDSTRAQLISWVPIAGWRDLAASEALVPSGAQPIFQDGDVLTYHQGAVRILSAVHDGVHLYIAHAPEGGPVTIERTVLVLGGGLQAPTWESSGPVALPAPEGTAYDTLSADLRSDGLQALLNVYSVARAAPGWNLSSGTMRFYEEWTLDLIAFPAVTANKTGDASVRLSRDWWDSTMAGDIQEILDRLAASPNGFALDTPPMEAPTAPLGVIDYRDANWFAECFFFSWYDRATQIRRRYTAEFTVEYEQGNPMTVNYAEDKAAVLPPAPRYAWCADTDPGPGSVCKVTDPGPDLGFWEQQRWKVRVRATWSLRCDGNLMGGFDEVAQDFDRDVKTGHFVNWTTAETLPCSDGGDPPNPCGDALPDTQRLVLSPVPVDGKTLDEYGTPYSGTGTVLDELDYSIRNPIIIGQTSMGDGRGELFHWADEQAKHIDDGVDQLGASRANHAWTVYDAAGGASVASRSLADVVLANGPWLPPSDGKHDFDAVTLPTVTEWEDWIAGVLDRLLLYRLYSFDVHAQPCIRLPDGSIFVAFASYDQFPTVQPQAVLYDTVFTPDDLRTLTGLDQVASTNERYTKLLEDGDSGPQIVIAGKQGAAGVL